MPGLEDLTPEARDELAQLARDLSDSPETRKEFLRLAKTKRPNMAMPELDIEDRISAIQKNADERVAAVEGKISDREMREELQRRRDALISSGKARSAEDVEAIEKVMLERGIQSHETAADYWGWMQQAAAPTPVSYGHQVLDKKTRTDMSAYWKNPIGAARDAAAQAFADLRKNPRLAG